MEHRVPVFLLALLALGSGGCGGGAAGGGTGGAATTSSSASSTVSSSSGGMGGMGGGGSTSSTSVTSGTSASSSVAASSSSSGSSDAGVPAHGDCLVDMDCPEGACVPVTPGGFLVCQTSPVKATLCTSALDQCCASKPCPNGEPCYAGPLVPVCSGVPMEPHNQCAADQCTQDSECADGQICAPAGTLGLQIRACIQAGCKVDADCMNMPGGVCAPVQEPCCNTMAGMFCVYPVGGCRASAECPATQYCQVSGNQALCQGGTPVCPL